MYIFVYLYEFRLNQRAATRVVTPQALLKIHIVFQKKETSTTDTHAHTKPKTLTEMVHQFISLYFFVYMNEQFTQIKEEIDSQTHYVRTEANANTQELVYI